MRRGALVVWAAAAALLASCKGGGATLQNAAESLVGDIDDLFGGKSAAVKQLAAIRDVNDASGLAFLKDSDEPLEKTRKAVRALATCDYPSWSEAALVVVVLSSMADEHESSLVRAECADTLTRMATWTFKYAVAPEHPSTDLEKSDAFKTLRDAAGRTDEDAALAFAAASAVSTMTSYPFTRIDAPPTAGADNKAAARPYQRSLREARVALRSMTGRTLMGFQGDPTMQDALEKAYPTLSSAVIRLTLIKAALADPSEPTRSAAVRDVASLAMDEGGPVLRRVLLFDGYSGVRREAAKALAAYPAAVAVPALIEGFNDEMADVRGAVAGSLEAVTGEHFGDDRGAWLRWWQTNGAKTVAGAGK